MTTSDQVVELKSCPFCGGKANVSPADDSGEVVYAVACMSCEAQITKCDEAGAIEQWNLRLSPPPADSGVVEALELAKEHFAGEPFDPSARKCLAAVSAALAKSRTGMRPNDTPGNNRFD